MGLVVNSPTPWLNLQAPASTRNLAGHHGARGGGRRVEVKGRVKGRIEVSLEGAWQSGAAQRKKYVTFSAVVVWLRCGGCPEHRPNDTRSRYVDAS